ncbi:MAG: hypothetical protein COB86_01150 [Dehalococcoidia bacterium]|nr:MAG: hypothetical protein COB86_01150 [Dehalococcoidia bacterium]
MARTPTVTRDQVPEKFRDAFDAETSDNGGPIDSGPGSAMIHSPEMRRRANHLVHYLRDESELPQRILELAKLIAGRAMDCEFIWNAHAAWGRREGLSDALVGALRDKKPLPPAPADEQALIDFAKELFATKRVKQATFDAAIDQFGARQLTELTTLMGYYSLLAMNANAFEINLPENRTEPVLPV